MTLEDRVVVVTGGGSGIGFATVERLRADGAIVVSLDLTHEAAAASAPALGIACDVGDESQVAAAFDQVIDEFGSISGVVANAGIALEVSLTDTTIDDWDRVMRVNLTGAFLTAKHALRRMPSGGSIVFHASMSGLVATLNEPAYCASKAGVIGLSRAIAVDYAAAGIRSNCVAPGVVETAMTREQFAPHPEFRESVQAMHPLGRFAQPEEVAGATSFLLSDDARFITGTVLTVDGGYTAR